MASVKDSTAANLKFSFFWTVTLRSWVILFRRFEGLLRFQLHISKAVFMRLRLARNLGKIRNNFKYCEQFRMPLEISLVFLPEFGSTGETSDVIWTKGRALENEEANVVVSRC
jgi:hypothetical protein